MNDSHLVLVNAYAKGIMILKNEEGSATILEPLKCGTWKNVVRQATWQAFGAKHGFSDYRTESDVERARKQHEADNVEGMTTFSG